MENRKIFYLEEIGNIWKDFEVFGIFFQIYLKQRFK